MAGAEPQPHAVISESDKARRSRAALVVLIVVEVLVIAGSLQWVRRYFDPALTDSDLGRRMVALRYPDHQLLLELATVALGLALIVAALYALAGRNWGRRVAMKLLVVAAALALAVSVSTINALYSVHRSMAAFAEAHPLPGALPNLGALSADMLQTGLVVTLVALALQLGAYAAVRFRLARA